MSRYFSRRSFFKSVGLSAAGYWATTSYWTGTSAAARAASPNEKLNIAVVGLGRQGSDDISDMLHDNIVAIADVDHGYMMKKAGKMIDKFPKVKLFEDFRVMFDTMENQIDAVVVATPDHVHFHPAWSAMQRGKHLYQEKPLAHNVWLEGETLRDAMLDAAGRLNLKMYGPSVHPALPDVLADTRYGWDEDKNPADSCRRSIYVLARRNMRLPLLEAFDQPDRLNSCPRRIATTTAPQALEMLNGQMVDSLARQWSGKLLAECGNDSQKLIRRAFIDAYARTPSENEIRSAESFLEKQSAVVKGDGAIEDGQLPIPIPNNLDPAKAAATVDFCHAIFCSNEFMYVD